MAHHTQVLRCDPDSITFTATEIPEVKSAESADSLARASAVLRAGDVVAFPTETVYGLGALALEPSAISRIFSTKGRPPDNPLIVHVSSHAMLRRILPPDYQVSRTYAALMEKFWPGPLTLLFPTDPSIIPPVVNANQRTVAVRMPSHPVARALIALTDSPVAAPSANSSGKPSPTRAEHVLKDLEGKIQLIIDGGPCGVGLESTVVDGLNVDGNLRVLRPGGVTVEQLEAVLRADSKPTEKVPKVLVHRRDYSDEAIEHAPTTPGMKYRHYSPTVPVTLLHTASRPPTGLHRTPLSEFLDSIAARVPDSRSPIRVGLLTPSDSPILKRVSAAAGIEWVQYHLGPLADPALSAQRLFDGLLSLDSAGVDLILVEEIAEEREGLAVMNRVKKAAGESVWVQS